MANEQNLIPFTSNQSREEAVRNGRKGGQKSGEVRRQRKAMQEQMNLLLSLPLTIKDRNGNDVRKILTQLGLEEDEIDNQMAMMISLWKTACGGGKNQVAAFQEIRKVVQDGEREKDSESINNVKEVLVKIREAANNGADN